MEREEQVAHAAVDRRVDRVAELDDEALIAGREVARRVHGLPASAVRRARAERRQDDAGLLERRPEGRGERDRVRRVAVQAERVRLHRDDVSPVIATTVPSVTSRTLRSITCCVSWMTDARLGPGDERPVRR